MKIPTFTTRQATNETNFSKTKADPGLAQACFLLDMEKGMDEWTLL